MNIYDLRDIESEVIEVTFNGQKINIKQRISETEKIIISKNIKEFYFTENGVSSEDIDISCKDLKQAIYIYTILSNYTNIEIGDTNNYIEIADIATKSGLIDFIVSKIPLNERMTLQDHINQVIEIEYRKRAETMSVENQLQRFLQMIIEKIPDESKIQSLIKTVKKEFKNFDPNKLQILNQLSKEYGGKEIPTSDEVNKIADNVLKVVTK